MVSVHHTCVIPFSQTQGNGRRGHSFPFEASKEDIQQFKGCQDTSRDQSRSRRQGRKQVLKAEQKW